MAKINVLDKHVAELIAAGRGGRAPSSVVKELVENSIDAGATSVTVEIAMGRHLSSGHGQRLRHRPRGRGHRLFAPCNQQGARRGRSERILTLGFRGRGAGLDLRGPRGADDPNARRLARYAMPPAGEVGG